MIQDANLRKKSMRKTIDRVDLGLFGKPIKLHAWHRAKRATWSGWAVTGAIQALVGVVLYTLGALAFGAPLNPLTLLFGLGFAVGCAIGDPISFLLWTILFVEITGTVSGVLVGAWFNLPSWWHVLADSWRGGQSVPSVFVGAVPVWMFVWILGGRGVAKGFDILVERATLKMGFNVAKRFMSEDERLRATAYEESAVSDIEAQRHFDVTDRDGTQAVIATEPSRIYAPEPQEQPAPRPSTTPAYQSYLEDDEDLNSDLSRRAAAGVRMDSGADAPSVDIGKSEAVSLGKAPTPTSFIMETGLPAPPVEQAAAPVQRAETPRLDTRANRALQRHMAQLVLSFDMVMTDDEMAAFVSNHRDVLMGLSDDQVRLLDTMEGGQALIAVARQLQSDNATSFIAGISDDKGPSEDLSLLTSDPMPLQASPIDMSSPRPAPEPVQAVAPDASAPGSDAEDVGEAGKAPEAGRPSDVLALAGALDAFLPDRRGNRPIAFVKRPSYDDLQGAPAAVPLPSDLVPAATGGSPEASTDEAGGEGGEQPEPEPRPDAEGGGTAEGGAFVPVVDSASADDGEASGEAPASAGPGEVGMVESPAGVDGAVAEPVAEAAPDVPDSGAVTDVPTAETAAGEALGRPDAVAEEATSAPPQEQEENASLPRPSSLSEGEFRFDVAEDVVSDRQPEGGANQHNQEEPENEMASYSRDEVLLVRGLLAANSSAQDKAHNVQEFQDAHPQLLVSDVVSSRSFVEYLGDHDAASVRHSWREVQSIIAAPPSERLGREFDRVNQRGQKFIEDPHLLDRPLYNHWEQESFRLRGAAAAAPGLLHSLGQHISINVSLGDSMRELLDKRDAAQIDSEHSMDSMPTVSQKVPKREDALRGRKMLGLMFRPGSGPREELPMTDPRRPETLAAPEPAAAPAPVPSAAPRERQPQVEDDVPLVPLPSQQDTPSASQAGEDMSSDRGPQLGEEGFVSRHPEGSLEYRKEMAAHREELNFRREEREERERVAEEERRREEARRAEQEREEEASRARIREQAEEAARLEAEERVRLAAAEADEAEARAEREREAARSAAAEATIAESRASAEAEVRSRTEVETMFLSAAKRAHSVLFTIPRRFHTQEILGAMINFEEISAYRKGLMLIVQKGRTDADPLKRNDTVGRARAESAQRSLVQYEVIVGEAAKSVLARVVTVVGASKGQDLMDLLEEGPEKVFVARLQNAIEAGDKAAVTLAEVEREDRELERLAEGSRGMDDLQGRLRDAEARVGVLFDEKQTFEERIAAAERDRDEAVAEASRLRREMMGEVDDEFQRVLDEHTTHIDDIGVAGFYKYVSPDKRSCFVIITAKSSSFPDGTVDVGDHSVSVSDIIEFAVDKAKTFRAKPEILFVDNGMRPYLTNRGAMQIGRDVGRLRDSLNIPA